ncbi:CD48 antigen-like isoform 4-T4 [Trichechus inunguis]
MDSLLTRWYFTQILMLKFSLILGVQTVKELHSPCTLNRTVGESAQLQLNSSLPLTIREIEWSWISEDEKNQLLVSWRPNTTDPAWYDFEDKYKHRFSLTELAFLSIRNLTAEMSGLYEAKIKFSSGKFQEDIVRLCVYEPIPQPQVLIHSSSKTSGWCNFTLECGTPGATENLTVTWLGKGLPGHLEKRGTQEPTPNSRIVSLSLPLSQVNTHVICVVSNPADQKNATLDLGSICLWRGSLWSKWLWKGIFATVLVVILGAGVWIWKRRKTETEKVVPSSAVALQALPTEDSADLQTSEIDSYRPPDAEISLLRHPKTSIKRSSGHTRSPEQTLAENTVYEMIRTKI